MNMRPAQALQAYPTNHRTRPGGECAGWVPAGKGGATRRRPRLAALGLAALLVGTPAAADDDLTPLGDEFDNPATLTQWQRINVVEGWHADQLEGLSIDPDNGGALEMVPYSSTWYQDWRGTLAFKEVTGDFIVTTHVVPTSRAGQGAPNSLFSLGGLLIRAPRPEVTGPTSWVPGGESYVFLSLGTADSPGSYQFEVKTTRDSISSLTASPGVSEAELRLARIGSYIIALRREPGGDWLVHARFDRPDMPDTLQTGMTVYTDWPTASALAPLDHNQSVITTGNPDLIARFDYVRFRRPEVPASLQGLDLSDSGVVSDAQLLAFLGASADTATADVLQVDASFAGGVLNLDLVLGPTEPVIWRFGMASAQGFQTWASIPLPPAATPITLSIPIPGFPSIGRIAIWSTFGNGDGEVVAADIDIVDTQ